MPVVLHANCLHVNRPHANSPYANSPHANSPYANSPVTKNTSDHGVLYSSNVRTQLSNLYNLYNRMISIFNTMFKWMHLTYIPYNSFLPTNKQHKLNIHSDNFVCNLYIFKYVC